MTSHKPHGATHQERTFVRSPRKRPERKKCHRLVRRTEQEEWVVTSNSNCRMEIRVKQTVESKKTFQNARNSRTSTRKHLFQPHCRPHILETASIGYQYLEKKTESKMWAQEHFKLGRITPNGGTTGRSAHQNKPELYRSRLTREEKLKFKREEHEIRTVWKQVGSSARKAEHRMLRIMLEDSVCKVPEVSKTIERHQEKAKST